MKLGFFERLYINSQLRSLVQRPVEFRLFNRIAPMPTHAHVLEIGCGNGSGLAYIAAHSSPASVTGIDLDLSQITIARRRLAALPIPYNLLPVSATEVPLPAHGYDVIFCSGCLHHIPAWPQAVTECARLLRHGGLLYIFEFYQPFLTFPLIRLLFAHPAKRFTQAQLAAELTQQGFTLLGQTPKPTNALKRWLNARASIAVYRLSGTESQYD